MGCGKEGFRAAECSQGERPPALYAVETTLNQIAGFVERFGVSALNLAVFARRDAGAYLVRSQPVTQRICIISTIRKHHGAFRYNWLKALFRTGYIGFFATRNGDPDRPANAIADQMQLAVQPTFGQPDDTPRAGVFNPVCGNSMGFDVRSIDHERAEIGIFLRKSLEYPLENSGPGPAFVAVVKDLGRPVFGRNIAPEIAALQAKDDPGQRPAVINPRHSARFVRQ